MLDLTAGAGYVKLTTLWLGSDLATHGSYIAAPPVPATNIAMKDEKRAKSLFMLPPY
jgi:hypothetical protein